MKKTLFFYSAFFLFLSIVQKGSGVLTKVIISKNISPYEYGIIALVSISLPGMFQLVTNLNFYYILSHAGEGKKYFGFTILYSLLITLILSIVLFLSNKIFFGYLNLPLEKWKLLYFVIVISMIFLSITIDFQGLITGLKLYSIPAIIMALPSITRLISVFYLIYYKITSFEIIILIFALSNVIPLIYILLSKQIRDYFYLIKLINIPPKKIFAFSASLFIVSSFPTIGQYIIQIIISHDLGLEWMGYYDVSLTLISILMFALTTMNYIAIPEVTSSNKNGIYEDGGLGDVSRGLFSLMIFLIIILYFYSEYIVVIIFSKDYILASKYVFILAASYPFLFIQMFLANFNLSDAKNLKEYLPLTILTIIFFPIFFLLTGFLIHLFKDYGIGNGFIGAYISNTILFILYTLLTIYYSKDLTPLKILLHKLDRLLVTILITFSFLYFSKLPPIIGMLTSGFIFAVLILLLGYMSKNMILEMFKSSKI